jgi:L-aspartate oxidase
VFGRRAALAALAEPLPTALREPVPALQRPELTQASRDGLWQHAGIERDADGLHTLLDDAHPLVRLVAACALAREESRGAHLRRDFPERDRSLDEHHTVVRSADAPVLEHWA